MSADATDWLVGAGETGALVQSIDWSTTSLGPIAAWPTSLRTAVGICLMSRFPMAVCWGREYAIVYNDAYQQILGAKHPWAMGRPCFEVWSELAHIVRPMFDGVIETGIATWSDDLMLPMRRHGYLEEAYFVVSYSAIRGESRRPEGVLVTVAETTDRYLAERRLELVRELGDASGGVRTVEQAGQVASAILARHQADVPFSLLYMTDFAAKEARLAAATGLPAGHLAAPSRLSLAAADPGPWPLGRAVQPPESLVVDIATEIGPLPGGIWPDPAREAVLLPIAHPGHAAPLAVLVAGVNPRRALDDRHREFFGLVAGQIANAMANAVAHEETRKRAEVLADLDRAKTAFFSNVSHEFRTPLTLMLGPLEERLQAGSLAPADRDAIALAHRNGLRLLRLVNTLLDFSRIEAGRVEAVYEPTDLAALTGELASVFRAAIEKAGLRYEVRCAPLDEPVHVDREMWEKIVLNLLSNAFKFTFEGSIAVELRDTGSTVELAVCDTGTGIPADELPRVFERFHRIEGARGRTFEGSGIGLALVRELVHLHGGTVRAESEPGRGSAFFVTIPKGTSHLPADRIGASRALVSTALGAIPFVHEALRWLPEAPGHGDLGAVPALRPRILVADDNADMRDYLTALLGARWEVETVAGGEQALAAARARRPDLVVTDVMMPGLDGFGLVAALRAEAATRDVPVIVLSARAGEESRVEGLDAGADDYVIKPFSARELVARVEAHLKLQRLRAGMQAALQERNETLETINRIGQQLAAQTALSALVQSFTDEATRLAGAGFGAFVYGAADEGGESSTRCALSGVSRAALEGVPWPRITELFGRTFPGEGIVRIDDVRRDARGGPSPPSPWMDRLPVTSYLAVPVVSRGGEVIGGLFLGHEQPGVFTERLEPIMAGLASQLAIAIDNARLFEAERKARAVAEAASQAKDEFLAVLSHELRTPINAVYGWAQLLRAGRIDGDAARRALDVIVRNAKAQVQLIDDMLDVSRIITGKLRLEVRPVDLGGVIEAALDAVRPSAAAKDIRLRWELDPRAVAVTGDPGRLQQVVWNLLANAIKFTPKGGRVQVHLRGIGSHVEIVVSDTGQGIAADVLPHVFDRFRQADSTSTRSHAGLGLGLALARHLVEAHGGRITASSPGAGLGATFTVELPIAIRRPDPIEQAQAPRHPAAESLPGAVAGPSLRGLRVLVVDDDRDGLDLAVTVLAHAGAEARGCASVAEGMRVFAQWRPDVIVSDIEMSHEDGYLLIRRVRALDAEHGRRTPAVALTAYGRTADRLRTLSAGYSMHVPKPVDPVELTTVVASLAGR